MTLLKVLMSCSLTMPGPTQQKHSKLIFIIFTANVTQKPQSTKTQLKEQEIQKSLEALQPQEREQLTKLQSLT